MGLETKDEVSPRYVSVAGVLRGLRTIPTDELVCGWILYQITPT